MNEWSFEAYPGESEEELTFERGRPRMSRGGSRPSRRPSSPRPAKHRPFPRSRPRFRPGWGGGVAVDVTVNEPLTEPEPAPVAEPGTSSSTTRFDPGTVSRPCPQKAGTAKDRCSSPRPCPPLPDLRCVTRVAGVLFHYVEAVGLDGATGLRKVTKRQEGRTQRLVPRALNALEAFVRNARSFGLPFDTILTLGSLYCRCVKGSNPPALSNHSFGDAIDVAGVRWTSGGPASRIRETIVHNWDDREQRVLLRRLNACLRLSFATVIDYHRSDHRDHFHCDTNQGRGRMTRGLATLRFVQEALGAVLGRTISITGKLDAATRKALLDYSKKGPEIFANDRALNQVFDQLFGEVASGRGSGAASTSGEVAEGRRTIPGLPLPGAPRFLWETEEELGFPDFLGFPAIVMDALRSGPAAVAVRLAVTLGFRDESKLTNLVFFARHPDRGGRKLEKSEPGFNALSREWLDIRDRLVRPALAGPVPAPSRPAPPVPIGGTLQYGVPGGKILSGYLKNRSGGYHTGIDVSTSSGKGGGAEDPRRGLPVYATIRSTLEIAALNSVQVALKKAPPWRTGLGIPGRGLAYLREARVRVAAPGKRVGSGYGGVVGLACRYTYTKTDGRPGLFTLFVEYWHLIIPEYLPKDGNGRVLSLAEWRASGKGNRIGVGPKMVDGAILKPGDFASPPLVGYLGATQWPHVHIHANYKEGEHPYIFYPRLDPTAVIR